MKLQSAINKLTKAGFEVKEVVEERIYRAYQEGKDTIEINADSTLTVYAILHIWEDNQNFMKNLKQAIELA